jgi:hypothetical protein
MPPLNGAKNLRVTQVYKHSVPTGLLLQVNPPKQPQAVLTCFLPSAHCSLPTARSPLTFRSVAAFR